MLFLMKFWSLPRTQPGFHLRTEFAPEMLVQSHQVLSVPPLLEDISSSVSPCSYLNGMPSRSVLQSLPALLPKPSGFFFHFFPGLDSLFFRSGYSTFLIYVLLKKTLKYIKNEWREIPCFLIWLMVMLHSRSVMISCCENCMCLGSAFTCRFLVYL